VEPIFLKSEHAARPELVKVALSLDNKVAWGNTFQDALHALFEGESASKFAGVPSQLGDPGDGSEPVVTVNEASRLLNQYFEQTGRGDTIEAGRSLAELHAVLQALSADSEVTAQVEVPNQ